MSWNIPKGWKLVPIMLTPEMEDAARRQGYYEMQEDGSVWVDAPFECMWTDALSAAPPPPPKESE